MDTIGIQYLGDFPSVPPNKIKVWETQVLLLGYHIVGSEPAHSRYRAINTETGQIVATSVSRARLLVWVLETIGQFTYWDIWYPAEEL